MEKTKSFLNIKSKLMAAVAMLLVAFFMVISSSYAWFTLSTAPEITGITTTVGANGNLEIALLYSNDATKTLTQLAREVKTGFVGSATLQERNLYWGNLVSLKDDNNDYYGLNNIKLLPTRINPTSTTAIAMASPLAVPDYVSTGQPSTLNRGTLDGVYTSGGFIKDGYGVRGIGTQSTMSQQEHDWNLASQNYNSAISRAAALTNSAIGENSQQIVDIVVGYAAGTTNFSEYVDEVAAIIAALEGTGTNGLVNYLETAQDEALKAIYAKAAGDAATAKKPYVSPTDVVVETTKTGDDYTITATVAGVNVSEVTGYAAFTTLCQKTYDISVALAGARTALNALYTTGTTTVKADVSWDEICAVLNPLFSTSGATIGGKTYADIQKETSKFNNTPAKAQWILENCTNTDKSVTVALGEGTGIFADVHTVTGKQIKATAYYMNLVPVHVQTNVTPTTINTALLKPNQADNASPYLTDLYGYALDFAFRTNAKGSNLLLSDAVNRIYSDSTNEETMGHGSVMTFSSSDPAFLATDVAELMGAIRIVFTDVDGNILAVGAAERSITNDGTTRTEGDIVTTLNGSEVTAKIILFDWELSYSANDDKTHGVLTLTGVKTNQQIMSLEQNTATVVSAYVYLDGDATDSSMVGTGTESMTGSINLQFASDANLKPMDYSDLKGQTTTN